MHLLFVTPMFQHPAMKCSLRHYYFTRELASRHRVSLLSVAQPGIPATALTEMRSFLSRLELVQREPVKRSGLRKLIQLRNLNRRLREALTVLVKTSRPDLVVFHGKEIFPAVEGLDIQPLVIDICDSAATQLRDRIGYQRWDRRPASALKYLWVRSIERRMQARSAYVSFISRRDWREAGGRATDRVIPNGVDLDYFKPSSEKGRREGLVFSGVMNYPPNEDAAIFLIEKIMPILWKKLPGLPLSIVGRDPGPRLRSSAGRCPLAEVTGSVEDLRPYLERAALFACPIRFASGTQNKVLEAMAMGLPVVTTPVVAEGVASSSRFEIPLEIASGEVEFARKLLSLLEDRARAARMGAAARRYVEQNAVWAAGAAQLEALCLEAVGREGPQSRVSE